MINFTSELKREMIKQLFDDMDSVFKEGKPHNYIDLKPYYDQLDAWLRENFSHIDLDEWGNQNVELDMGPRYVGMVFTGNHEWKGFVTVTIETSIPLEGDYFTDIAYHDKHGDGDVIN